MNQHETSYTPATVRRQHDGRYAMSCAEGHDPDVRLYDTELAARRSAVRHLKAHHPLIATQLPPRGGQRRLRPQNPHTAQINCADLITMRAAADLLGRQHDPSPAAIVQALIRRGTLVAYADPAAPTNVNTRRYVLRSAVEQLLERRRGRRQVR